MTESGRVKHKDQQTKLADAGYIADEGLAMALSLAMTLKRSLLLEGEAGVGKTEIAKVLAEVEQTDLIRLQCYEGLDANAAIYEWNYQRQLLAIKVRERAEMSPDDIESHIFSEPFLLRRPLLEAISRDKPPVLLIDEIDRADEEFEAYLLEILSDFQVTVPEFGTISARAVPHVILTSNSTRELSDALRRRCLYSYVDYPDPAKELRIVKAHMPDIDDGLARQIVGFVQSLRGQDLEKKPGIAESLDWAAALVGLAVTALADDPDTISASLVCLLKTEADLKSMTPEVTARLIGKVA